MEAMKLEVCSKESRSQRSRVMQQTFKCLGERVKAASAEGDGARARRLLSQLQVRVLKRTRAVKRIGFCKKSSSMLDLEGSRRQPPLPAVRSFPYELSHEGDQDQSAITSTSWSPSISFSAIGGDSKELPVSLPSPEMTSTEGLFDSMEIGSTSEIKGVTIWKSRERTCSLSVYWNPRLFLLL